MRLKHVARMRAGGTPSVDDPEMWSDTGVAWVTISDMTRSARVVTTERRVTGLAIKRKRLPVGGSDTVLFAMYASVGALAVLGVKATWNQAIIGLNPLAGRADSRFVSYWLEHLRPNILELTRSSTQDNLNATQVANLPFPYLSLNAQRAIADFLDAETARIDTLIARKRRLVALLEERIDHLVSAQIAGSSLVDVTPDGSAAPIKKVLAKVERPPPVEGAEMITAFRDGQVTARSRRRVEGYTQSWTDTAQVQGVRRGDVVIHGLDGFAGAIGVSEVDGVCSPVYHVCEPRDDGDPLFLGRMLRNLAISGYLGLFSSSTRERAVDFRNWDLFGRIPIPAVSSTEQREVARLIRRVRPLKDVVERSAELTAERRQALITAVVTGELEVPEVATPRDGRAAE